MVPCDSGATSTPMMKKMRPHAASEKATGISDQQENDERRKHDRSHVVRDEFGHL